MLIYQAMEIYQNKEANQKKQKQPIQKGKRH